MTIPDALDLSILDDIGVGSVAGLGYDALGASEMPDLLELLKDFSEFAVSPSSDGLFNGLISIMTSTGPAGDWAETFCDEVISNILKKAGMGGTQASQVKKALDGIFGNDDYRKLLGCVFVVAVLISSYVGGVASGVQTHLVRQLNKTLKPNTGDLNDVIKGLFLDDPSLNIAGIKDELGLGDPWWRLVQKSRESRASVGELAEQFRRGKLDDAEFDQALKKLGYREDAQSKLLVANAERIPGLSDAARILQRGRSSLQEVQGLVRLQGFSDEHRSMMLDSIKPTLSDDEAIRLNLAGLMSDSELSDFSSSRGWDAGDFNNRKELGRSMPNIVELRQALYRGIIEPETFKLYLQRLGFDEGEITLLQDNSELLYTPSDLIRFSVREVFTPAIAERFGMNQDFPDASVEAAEKIGLSKETLKLYWAAHWDLPSPGQGFEMFHRGIIDEADLKLLLRALDVMPFWQERMIQLSYNVVPRRVVNTLWRDEIITDAQFLDHYKQLGFSPEDSRRVLQGEQIRLEEPERIATKGDIVAAYVVGEITAASARSKLKELNFSDSAIALILETAGVRRRLFEESLEQNEVVDTESNAPAAIRNDILTAYRKDLIPRDTAVELLIEFGIPVDEVIALLAHEDNDREFRTVEFELKQLKRIFDARAEPDRLIADRLTSVGVIAEAQRRVMSQWNAEREADELVQASKVKQPTKTDLKDFLVKGIIDPTEWIEGMLRLGYDERTTQLFLAEIVADEQEQ